MSDFLGQLPSGTTSVLHYAGIVLIVIAVALAAAAVIVFFKLDIRGVRDDLAGRVRAERTPQPTRQRRSGRAPKEAEQKASPGPALQQETASGRVQGKEAGQKTVGQVTGLRPSGQRAAPPQQGPGGVTDIRFTVTKRELGPAREDVLGNEEQSNG